ncbi:MAG: hypothetical protein KJO44_08355 [Gemmatimonadetes bacterium]|nr:hypothetical protein [Gemmatimonadota bacterium]
MRTRKAGHGKAAAALVFATLTAGCAPAPEEGDPDRIHDDVYVEVMTELLLLDASLPKNRMLPEREAAGADSLRKQILDAHGVTPQDLLEFAELIGGEAGHMEALWERITHEYDSTRIAQLRAETEARSEAEGKLGEAARIGETDGRGAVRGPRDSTAVQGGSAPTRGRFLQRPVKPLPRRPDTTRVPN